MAARVILCFLSMLFCFCTADAQPSIKAGYGYLHSPEIDKIFQTYNTSRPWLGEPLVPLTNSFSIDAGWNWRIQKSHEIHLLPEISYARFVTSASNNGKTFAAGFQQFGGGISIRIHPKSIFKQVQGAGPLGTRFFILAGANYSGFIPFSKTNGDRSMRDKNTSYREVSFAPDVMIGAGYHVARIGRFILTPELSAHWTSSLELIDFTEVVNGHNVLGLSNISSNVFIFNVGLRITMIGSQKNWWDRPREGDKT